MGNRWGAGDLEARGPVTLRLGAGDLGSRWAGDLGSRGAGDLEALGRGASPEVLPPLSENKK